MQHKPLIRFCALALFGATCLGFPISAHAKAPTEQTAHEKVFNAKSYTLNNGMQIVVVENHRAPVLTHMVWYKVGAADEASGKSGIAHFLEHLMFKGQNDPKLGDLKAGEFSRIIRSLGGQDNAFTSQDYTAYYQSISKDHLETVMTMEAGRMRGLAPPLEDVASENKVIQEERRQRTDNDPRAKMSEQLNEALFPNHPYSVPIIGWMHEIQELSWDDAKAFYDIYYAPNNAILIVSGDVIGDEVFEIAKRTYGTLNPADTPERIRTKSPSFIAQTSVTLRDATIREPVFLREYRVPSFRLNAQDSLALQVLEEIMSGGTTSRLYQSLVVDQNLATEISLSYSAASWDDSTLSIQAIPSGAENLTTMENAIDAQLRLLIKDGVSDTERSDAITRMQAAAIYARDSLSGPAMIIGYNLVTGSTLDDIEHWPSQIEQVTKEQITDVAARYLNPDMPSSTPPIDGFLLPPISISPTAEQEAE